MGKYRRCLVCDNSTKDNVVLHKFPNRISSYYSGWVEFCRRALFYVKEEDNFSSCFICSIHFNESDYRLPKILKIGAVPSVLHIKKKFPEEFSFKHSPQKNSGNIVEKPSNVVPISTIAPSPTDITETIEEIASDCQDANRKYSSAKMPSPNKAELSLMKAKSTIDKKNKEIKLLRQKNRRLTNKIESLKNLVNHLKSKALISEESGEVITVVGPYAPEVKKKGK